MATFEGMKNYLLPKVLLAVYLVLFIILSFDPNDRVTWWAENLTVWILLSGIIILYVREVRFSDTAYFLMTILLVMHTIGGHYTFEKVPFTFVTEFFGFERNNYDRFAHFSVGFYAYPVTEWLHKKNLVRTRFLLFTYPVFVIATAAMSYELIEWWYASASVPAAGANYLGSQGDIWDAQKDMLCDSGGALAAAIFYFLQRRPSPLS